MIIITYIFQYKDGNSWKTCFGTVEQNWSNSDELKSKFQGNGYRNFCIISCVAVNHCKQLVVLWRSGVRVGSEWRHQDRVDVTTDPLKFIEEKRKGINTSATIMSISPYQETLRGNTYEEYHTKMADIEMLYFSTQRECKTLEEDKCRLEFQIKKLEKEKNELQEKLTLQSANQ